MSSPFAVVRIVCSLALVAVGCVLCLLGTPAAAQTNQPIDEVFGGYSWLHSDGYGDLNYWIKNIPAGFDFSNTYYFRRACNFGVVFDGGGHINGGTQPRNPFNAGNEGTGVGFALAGLQYKHHGQVFSPFARFLVGGANHSPDCCGGTRWSVGVGGGGGLDINLSRMFSIRAVQADYIYSDYPHTYPNDHSTA